MQIFSFVVKNQIKRKPLKHCHQLYFSINFISESGKCSNLEVNCTSQTIACSSSDPSIGHVRSSPQLPLTRKTSSTLLADPALPASTNLEGYVALLKKKKVNKTLCMYSMYRAARGPQKLKRSMKSWGEREVVQLSGLFAVHGCFVSYGRGGRG